jgi:myo-inositol 2-dehydrogenase/D-chiro-inositol 1-dehydrogenase
MKVSSFARARSALVAAARVGAAIVCCAIDNAKRGAEAATAEKAMRFGLIGYGAWGRYHARSIQSLPGLVVAHVASRSGESASLARRDFPAARVTLDWHDVIADPDVDVVDVVLPNHLHAEVGCAALAAGKDVLLEKPMAITRAQCDALVAAAAASGRVLSIGHEFRLSTQWGRAKEAIDRGDIGVPLFCNVNLFRNFYRSGADGWRYDRARVGSWILEEAVHFFDFVLWYMEAHGDPLSVRAYGNQRPDREEGMYDNFSALLRFAGGAYATITQSVAGFEHHLVIEVTGTEGAVRTAWSGAMDRDHHPVFDYRVQPKGFAFERGVRESEHHDIAASGEVYELTEQIRRTVEALAARKPLVSGQESRKRVICCIEAERSIREAREVALDLA